MAIVNNNLTIAGFGRLVKTYLPSSGPDRGALRRMGALARQSEVKTLQLRLRGVLL